MRLLPAADHVVEGKDIPHDHDKAPAVLQHVVIAPEEPIVLLVDPEQGQARVRRRSQVETTAPCSVDISPQSPLLFHCRRSTPVMVLYRDANSCMHKLQRPIESFPYKG